MIEASDGVSLFVDVTDDAPARPGARADGDRATVVFVHEFAGSTRSFDAQVQALRSQYRCVTFNARGYPPSQVPPLVDAYGEARAARDIIDVLDGLNIAAAHLVGVSMGAASALQCALHHQGRVASLVLASIGSGSDSTPEQVRATTEGNAALVEQQGMAALAAKMLQSPTRQRLALKNPAETGRFRTQIGALSPLGAANTMRGVQQRRGPIYAHEAALRKLDLPVLVIAGGEDTGCLKPSRFVQQAIAGARLEVLEGTGHAINLEEPEKFNELVLGFLTHQQPRHPA